MKLHEYQAKELLRGFGVPTPRGSVVLTPNDALAAAKSLGGNVFVVKAQVHAGGRGKAGGVKVVKSAALAHDAAAAIIGMNLVSKQTGAQGVLVRKALVEEGLDIKHEFYLGMLIDRDCGKIVVMASREGGMEIEEVAAKSPEKIFKEYADPINGIMPFNGRNLGYKLGLDPQATAKFTKLLLSCYRAFVEKDLSLIEINPLVLTGGGDVVALDAKVSADDNALMRHKDVAELRDTNEEDPREVEASKHDLNYIGLDGSIGCLVNGAGLAMATMDIIKYYGSWPANFLDVGGGATEESVTAGFKIILADSRVRAILVNIFGGIIRCDVIAKSVVAAAKEVATKVPLVVRLEGTNAEAGREILKSSGLTILPATTMDDAAQKVVKEANGNNS